MGGGGGGSPYGGDEGRSEWRSRREKPKRERGAHRMAIVYALLLDPVH